MRTRIFSVVTGSLLVALGLAGCNFSQAGIDPIPNTLNFPMAIALSPATNAEGEPRYLFVANSNFNLRFNAGSLWAIDLDAVEAEIGRTQGCPGPDCELWPLRPVADDGPNVDPDSGRDVVRVIADEVGIGSHADGLAVNRAGDRLYLPIRGGSQELTFVPFSADQGAFLCDQVTRDEGDTSDIPRCAERFRTGHLGEVSSTRELVLTGAPIAVGTGSLRELGSAVDADYVITAQDNGTVALYLDRHDADMVPELIHVAEGFPTNIVDLAIEPGTGVAWMTSATTNQLARAAISVDAEEPTRSFLYNFGGLRLRGVDDGEDSRDIVFHPTDPSRAFVLSRRPEAVIEIAVERRGLTQSDVAVTDLWEVGAGPSRLAVAELGGTTYAFASCFDAQRLFVIDADHGSLVGVVGGFSGPFEVVVDDARQILFMADFSTSVIRMVDLSGLATDEPPTAYARLGELLPISSLTD